MCQPDEPAAGDSAERREARARELLELYRDELRDYVQEKLGPGISEDDIDRIIDRAMSRLLEDFGVEHRTAAELRSGLYKCCDDELQDSRGLPALAGPCDASQWEALADMQLLADAQAYLKQKAGGARAAPELAASWQRFWSAARRLIDETLRGQGVPRSDVEDLAQDVWIAILEGLPAFRPRRRGSTIAWIRQIATRRAAAYGRMRERRRSRPVPPEELAGVTARDPDPASVVSREELRALLHEAADALDPPLTPNERKILDDYMLGPCSAKEVGAELGMTDARVRYVAWKIRQELASELIRRGVEDMLEDLVRGTAG